MSQLGDQQSILGAINGIVTSYTTLIASLQADDSALFLATGDTVSDAQAKSSLTSAQSELALWTDIQSKYKSILGVT